MNNGNTPAKESKITKAITVAPCALLVLGNRLSIIAVLGGLGYCQAGNWISRLLKASAWKAVEQVMVPLTTEIRANLQNIWRPFSTYVRVSTWTYSRRSENSMTQGARLSLSTPRRGSRDRHMQLQERQSWCLHNPAVLWNPHSWWIAGAGAGSNC